MKAFAYFFLLSFLVLFSCEREVETFDESKFGYDYFPLEVGRSWTYQVDSIIYDDEGATVFNKSAQIREDVVEIFTDAVGDEIFRIERFWRPSDSTSWEITDVWVASVDEGRAYRTEENLKFIKFVFPALEGTEWNGNIFFDESTIITVAGEPIEMFKDWDEYELISVDEPEQVGGISYDQVATVLQTDNDETNSIERRFSMEKYARGVGLIYKENIILDSQNADITIDWLDRAEAGFILKQTLIEYQ